LAKNSLQKSLFWLFWRLRRRARPYIRDGLTYRGCWIYWPEIWACGRFFNETEGHQILHFDQLEFTWIMKPSKI
jgi:hypothetical protein